VPKAATQVGDLPVTLPDSHFDFVLIGPHEGDQKVLAQSNNLDLLLLGMARTPSHLLADEPSERGRSKKIPRLYENDPNATLYSVTALATVSDQPDARAEPFTFAWIGRSPHAEVDVIGEYFNNCVVSLHQATQDEDPVTKLRWELAPLLFLCAKWTKTTRETEPEKVLDYATRRYLIVFVVFVSVFTVLTTISTLVSMLVRGSG